MYLERKLKLAIKRNEKSQKKREKKDLPIIKIKPNRKPYLGRKPKSAIDRNKEIQKKQIKEKKNLPITKTKLE